MNLVFPETSRDFICIDPGVNIGIAGFVSGFKYPKDYQVIKPKFGSWDQQLKYVLYHFEDQLKRYKSYPTAYIEKPAFHETNKGLASARTGSLFKLIKAYVLEQHILERCGFNVIDLEITQWKKQLDKRKVDHRIKLILGEEYPEHISDAIGMGLYIRNEFKVKL